MNIIIYTRAQRNAFDNPKLLFDSSVFLFLPFLHNTYNTFIDIILGFTSRISHLLCYKTTRFFFYFCCFFSLAANSLCSIKIWMDFFVTLVPVPLGLRVCGWCLFFFSFLLQGNARHIRTKHDRWYDKRHHEKFSTWKFFLLRRMIDKATTISQ